MKKLTTPQAILIGLSIIALSITSLPFFPKFIKSAHALNNVVVMQRILDGQKKIIREIKNNCS